MSEFTSGFLIEHVHEARIAKYAQSRSVTKRINDKWVAYLTDGDNDSGILEMSNEFPVLFFDNAEDHGWGYQIFNKGNKIASLRIDYELEEGLVWSLVQERYPDDDPFDIVYVKDDGNLGEEIREEVRNNLGELIKKSIHNANIGNLSLFGIDDEKLKQLQGYLEPSAILTSNNLHETVAVFKKLLYLDEMSWISYDHVVEDGEYDVMFE